MHAPKQRAIQLHLHSFLPFCDNLKGNRQDSVASTTSLVRFGHFRSSYTISHLHDPLNVLVPFNNPCCQVGNVGPRDGMRAYAKGGRGRGQKIMNCCVVDFHVTLRGKGRGRELAAFLQLMKEGTEGQKQGGQRQ